MKDGTHQKHSLKPDPDNESKLQRALPVTYLKTHNKVGDHKGDDKVLGKLRRQAPKPAVSDQP